MNAKDISRRVLNSRAVRGTKKVLRDHGADIFSILAGIGVIATGVTAFNAGRNEQSGESDDGERVWKVSNLLVPVSCGAGTIGCIYAARKYGKLKEESLLAACSALAVYAKRKEQAGNRESDEEPERQVNSSRDIEDTGTGDVIFVEDFTGRRFKASWECYEYAKRKLQENFSIAQCVTLNDFYGLLNLSETSAGEVLGWTIDQMIMDPYYAGGNLYYEDALTQLCIEEDIDEDGNVIIYYCVLPIGSLAGVGPCNH